MAELLDISEIVRRTGLTARALRFYEARGLVRPLRTASGRRVYGPGELERIHRVLALKRAGLTLAQIQRLSARGPLDLAALVDAQLEVLRARAAEVEGARTLLLTVKSRIDRGEPIDAETFCSLIRNGGTIMETENWKQVVDRYFTPEQQADWAGRKDLLPPDFDQSAYSRRWEELGARIEAALPLDPAGAQAQALLDEWNALLAPFNAVATPEMKAGAESLYSRMGEWQGEQKPPFSQEAWQAIRGAAEARKARGGRGTQRSLRGSSRG